MTADPRTIRAIIIEVPPIDGDEARFRPFLAASAARFGAAHVWRSIGGNGYHLWCSVGASATMGRVVSPLAAAAAGMWQQQTLDVVVDSGELYGAPHPAVLAGFNLLAIKSGGAWELIRFAGAELTGLGAYSLTDLRRGCHGTVPLDIDADAELVLLDDAVIRLPLHPREIGLPMSLRIAPADRPYTDATALAIDFAPTEGAHRWPELLVQPVVSTVGSNTPPDDPVEGVLHIIGPAPSGAWAGRPGSVAGFLFGAWRFQSPFDGYTVTHGPARERLTWWADAWSTAA